MVLDDDGCGCAESSAMVNIWRAAEAGDVGEVERLVGQDPGLLDAGDGAGTTPLMWASMRGHVGVVRWLLDKGAAINGRDATRCTALWYVCVHGHAPVVRLLMERGADPTIANVVSGIPMIAASKEGHLEVVRFLLGHPSAKAAINHRDESGQTALWRACYKGCGGVVRALLESRADPTIASNNGTTPMAIAKQPHPVAIHAEGRRECVAALEVRLGLPAAPLYLSICLSSCFQRLLF
jgi:ankyrin repeat protein